MEVKADNEGLRVILSGTEALAYLQRVVYALEEPKASEPVKKSVKSRKLYGAPARVMAVVNSGRTVTSKTLVSVMGMSEGGANVTLQRLRKKGLIKKIGTYKRRARYAAVNPFPASKIPVVDDEKEVIEAQIWEG